jgi:hypothetical protein
MKGQPRGKGVDLSVVEDPQRRCRHVTELVDGLGCSSAASAPRRRPRRQPASTPPHQEDPREFHLESAGEHLGRPRNRSVVMNELGAVLGRHLAAASSPIDRAGEELGRSPDVDQRDTEVRALRSQIDVLGEVVSLARPVADQITRHAVHAAEASSATEALMLLETRVHDAGRQVSRSMRVCR